MNTHYAVIHFPGDPAGEHLDPALNGRAPALELIGCGPEDFCWDALRKWTETHPLRLWETAEVLARTHTPGEIMDTATPTLDPERILTPEPEDFGFPFHGIHLYSNEDDWGWIAYGHHDPKRVVAAVLATSRSEGVEADLREDLTAQNLFDAIENRWGYRFRTTLESDWMVWDWCTEDTPGAVAITWVAP